MDVLQMDALGESGEELGRGGILPFRASGTHHQ